MATRPNNHITGDNAVRQISANLIPSEWIVNEIKSDYGLDMFVEVVEDNATTGRHLYIQSKGTTECSKNGIIQYSLSVERILDYSRVQEPILFVYYSIPEDVFWGRWMNFLYASLSEHQKQQHTVTLSFTAENKIDRDYLQTIGPHISIDIARVVSVKLNNSGIEEIRLVNHILNYSHDILSVPMELRNPLAVNEVSICIKGGLSSGELIISHHDEELRVALAITDKKFLYYKELQESDVCRELSDALFAMSFLSRHISIHAFQYVLSNVNNHTICLVPEATWHQFICDLPLEYDILSNLDNLFDLSLASGIDLSQYILMILFCWSAKNKNDSLYKRFLKKYLDIAEDGQAKGHLFYNLANSVRANDCREAIYLYRQSAKFFPTYKNMFYWNQEVAGCCYMLGRYYFAQLFYEKTRKLDKHSCRDDIAILISDCLICQGKYIEAQQMEEDYLKTRGALSMSLALKMKVTEQLITNNISSKPAFLFFNDGITASRENRHLESMWDFLIAWRFFDGDLEALSNAFLMAYNLKDYNMVAIIVATIKEINPDEGYRRLVNVLSSNMDAKYLDQITSWLDTIFFRSDV